MKTAIVFICVLGLALSRNVENTKRNEQQSDVDYICPSEGQSLTHLSYCAWDPCIAFIDDPHPCKNHPDAVCIYNVCPNTNCMWQFFVGNQFVECEL